jgi:ABC-type transport system involved in multi-copper enzyme maturation permease subunit
MSAILAIALNGFREARRNRITSVLFVFAFVLVFSTTVSIEFTVATFDRVMTDFGLGVIGLIAPVLTLFLGTGLIPREIERRTIFMVVARPVSRTAFVLGKFFGNVVTVGGLVVVMGALFLVQLQVAGASEKFSTGIHAEHLVALYGLLLEVVLLSAVAFAFASASSQFVSSLSVACLYFIGHMAEDLYTFAGRSKIEVLRWGGRALYYVLPNFDRLDFKARATYFDPTSFSELVAATGYTLAYSTIMLAIAAFVFDRRDFK